VQQPRAGVFAPPSGDNTQPARCELGFQIQRYEMVRDLEAAVSIVQPRRSGDMVSNQTGRQVARDCVRDIG
jgi:hypothetical protein